MEQGQPLKLISYIFLIAFFFSILFVLDGVFDVHYTHNIHHPELLEESHDNNHDKEEPDAHSSQKEDAESHHGGSSTEEFIDEPESQPSTPETTPDTNDDQEETTSISASADPELEKYFENLKETYLKEKLDKLPTNQARTDIVIRYYHHAPDGESAYQLQNLRYYIHERPVDPEYANHQSNAVFYGDSIQIEDIQLVTYTLLKAGLPIKTIKPSKFASSWKAKSIEIGTDTTLTNQPTLSLQEIKNLSI
ncbi:hypothetical protein [Marinoscillum furvescens]|uniref:Uncharacterized protein n=1 Tax=Marinoscillum furvescens DSM 4134 TaxID=1122208 RepID=A0A3D9KZU2_MARFU|nr:hypothetical protein [Marinoscillum furvescens]RED93645.1 hypothetical protein C7460_12455 [Marinoscillum furvescens DSM 4134]